jgi:mono/diheme cytochrome c family protein
VGADRNAAAGFDDPFGESVRSIVYLDQNWSPGLSQQFYFTSQGSQVLPYAWFLALEQPDTDLPFRDQKNLLKYRYLPQKPDARNPDGLPVGFAMDVGRDRAWLGFNCAACHTGEIDYQGVGYRIDGAPALGNITGLLRSLTAALAATRDQAAKFDRFAAKVLAGSDTPEARSRLKDELTVIIDRREGYNARNFPPGNLAGYARIDAFGAILNEVFHHAVKSGDLTSNTTNTKPATAPVSIPFLWDTPQHDKLQWNGAAQNGGPGNIGALGRNVGEVLGVFGDFEIPDAPGLLGYRSSVQVQNLRAMEGWVTTLWSPQWPAAFPRIDAAQRDKGQALYAQHCITCHALIDRANPQRKVTAVMFGTGTDRLMADNFWNRVGKSGKLEGSFSKYFPLFGEKLQAETRGELMLDNAVIGTIVGSAFPAPKDELTAIELGARPVLAMAPSATGIPEIGPRYKARPLNGIWATAPYLHNGSVASLYQLLLPAKDRLESFTVGSRQFDPVDVGFRTDAPGFPRFVARDDQHKPIAGNSNEGHEYANTLTDAERRQLVEYLKSL